MKKIIFITLISLFTLSVKSQIVAGDIAFIGFNEDLPVDGFSIITLNSIPGNSTIYFTDQGISSATAWVGNTEDHWRFTAPASGISCGTIISFTEDAPDVLTITGVSGASMVHLAGTGLFNLSGGDQMIAYTVSVPGVPASPASATFIAAITTDDGNGAPTCLDGITGWSSAGGCIGTSVSRSLVPPGLTNGVNCISLHPTIGTEIDNNKYNGTLTGTSTSIRTSINNRSNWISDDITIYNITPSGYLSPSIICGSPCPTPTVSLNAQTNVSCNGGSNGSASIAATGGSPFTYAWSPSGGTGATATGLTAGNYTCVVTNSCGISASQTILINQPATALSTSTAVTNVLCNGGSTGSATVTATGGTAGYTYLWSGAQTTSVITGQTAGVKTVTVTDANGCSSIKGLTITQPVSALNTATIVTNVLCNGGSTGSATITATGGTAGYTYLWSGAQTTSVITGQTAGVKTVTVTDANGCTSIKGLAITQPVSALNTATVVANVLCNGGSTGSATVTATGGTAGYTYLWSGAQTTSVITGQIAGVKTVTVTDANSCSTSNTVTITQPTSLTLTAIANNTVICSGGSSTLTANGTGGTGAITYTWASGPTNSVNIISPTITTIYTVSITDVNSCATSQTLSVAVVSSPTISVNSGTICNGNNFTIIPSGASTYTITGGATIVSPSSTTAYTVTGSSGGCAATNTVISSVIVNAVPTITVNNGSICSGNTFTIIPGGGSTYTFSGGSSIVSPLANFNYTITGTSVLGCTNTAISSVTVNTTPTITVNSGAICSGNSFIIIPSGASTYTYSSGSNIVTTNTTVTVTGTSSLGCVASNTAVSSVTVNALPSVSATTSNTLLCVGSSANLTATGAMSYTWNTGALASTIAISPTITTTYTVAGLGTNGCSNTATITQSVSTCTGIDNISITNNSVLVYPNPTSGDFFIDVSQNSEVVISDVLGKDIYMQHLEIGKNKISISNYTSCVYFIKVKTDSNVKIIRLIMQ